MKLFRENGQVIAVIVSLVVVAVLLSGQIGRVEDRLTARIDRVEARIGRVEDRVHSIEVFLRGDRVGSGEEAQ